MLFEKVFTLPVAIQAKNIFDLICDQRPPSSVFRISVIEGETMTGSQFGLSKWATYEFPAGFFSSYKK